MEKCDGLKKIPEKSDKDMYKQHYDKSESGNLELYGVNVSQGVINSDFKLHTHDFYEASIVVSGKARHVIGENSFPLKRGDIYVIKSGIAHGFYDVETRSNFYVPGGFVVVPQELEDKLNDGWCTLTIENGELKNAEHVEKPSAEEDSE